MGFHFKLMVVDGGVDVYAEVDVDAEVDEDAAVEVDAGADVMVKGMLSACSIICFN